MSMVNAMRPSVIHWPLLGSLGPRPMYRLNPPLIGPASTYRIRIIRYLTLNFIWNNSSYEGFSRTICNTSDNVCQGLQN